MTLTVAARGDARHAIDAHVPALVEQLVASRITAGDSTLWGAAAEAEASIRLGWTQAVSISRPLVAEIVALRGELAARGVSRIVLCGMGGSSLAPEVITRTTGAPLVVLDSTDPGQVATALGEHLGHTAVVVSSKSGSTIETDSQKRSFETAFRAAGIDPAERIIIVTDPGSPLEQASRAAGYRVFTADPTVGGRYSALTAFGLVPSGLAGVDLDALLDEAEAASLPLAVDSASNPGLQLGAAIAGTVPLRDKLVIVADGTHIVGLGDWIEQLVAESTGKDGRGILPVVVGIDAPELSSGAADVQVVRLVADARATREVADGEIELSGSLGAHLLTWQYATAIAGMLLGINPFDQPDVESAKVAARGLLDARPAPLAALFVDDGVEVVGPSAIVGRASTVSDEVRALEAALSEGGYVAVHAYLDRLAHPELEAVRHFIAERTGRPVTFGWGPRFLHSTGQYHKGGPALGVFLQVTGTLGDDLDIPDRPFTYGQLIAAQAAGDAAVLGDKGMPVVTLRVRDADGIAAIIAALS
ncbi:MAG: glucose-6-phosphate isomerase [Microbacteriaceae bacterium]|nr:glucose-6-phosphate isomerase [Microbacteriaceae bacterium]